MHKPEKKTNFTLLDSEANRDIVQLLSNIDKNNQNTETQIVSFLKTTMIGTLVDDNNIKANKKVRTVMINNTMTVPQNHLGTLKKKKTAPKAYVPCTDDLHLKHGIDEGNIVKSKSLPRGNTTLPLRRIESNIILKDVNTKKDVKYKKSNTLFKSTNDDASELNLINDEDPKPSNNKRFSMTNKKSEVNLHRQNSAFPIEEIAATSKVQNKTMTRINTIRNKMMSKNRLAEINMSLKTLDKNELMIKSRASNKYDSKLSARPSESIDLLLDRSRCEVDSENLNLNNKILRSSSHLLSNHTIHSPKEITTTANIATSHAKLINENGSPIIERLNSIQFSPSQSPNLDLTKKILKSKSKKLDKKDKKLTFFDFKPEVIKKDLTKKTTTISIQRSDERRQSQHMEGQMKNEEYEDNDFKRRSNYWIKGERSLRFTDMVYDSLSDQELENGELKDTDIRDLSVHPESKIFFWINLLIVIGLAFTVIICPVYYSQDFLRWRIDILSILTGILDILLMSEIILRFFAGFYYEDDIIFSFEMVALNYTVFGEFLFDLLVTFPFNLIYLVSQSDTNTQDLIDWRNAGIFLRTYEWARWLRILGIFKLWGKIDFLIYKVFHIEEHGKNYKMILFIKFWLFFMIGIHILNCLFIYISKVEMHYGYSNWIQQYKFDNESYFTLYFVSFYFNMATILSIGYGDVTPVSFIERTYMCFYMFFSVHVYSFIISWISNKISQNTRKEEIFSEKKEILDSILVEFNINESLEKQLKKSLNFMKKNYVADKEDLLNCLPDKLKNSLYKKIYENRIGELDFFKSTPEEFIMYCTPRLQLVSLKKREVLISIGDIFTEMYMVNKGNLNFYLGMKFLNFKINSMGRGYHFGDVNMYLNERSEYTIKSSSIYTEIFTLKKGNYSELKMNFPEIIDYIIKKSIDNFTNLEARRNQAIEYYKDNSCFSGFISQIRLKEYEAFCKSFYEEDRKENNKSYEKILDMKSNQSYRNVEYLTNIIDEGTTNVKKKRRRVGVFNEQFKAEKFRARHSKDESNLMNTKNILNKKPQLLSLDSFNNRADKRRYMYNNSIIPGGNASFESATGIEKNNRVNIVQEEITRHKKIFSLSKSYYEDQRKGRFQKKKNFDKIEHGAMDEIFKVKLYLYKKFMEDSLPLLIYTAQEHITEFNSSANHLTQSKNNFSNIKDMTSRPGTRKSSASIKPPSIVEDLRTVFNDDSLEFLSFPQKSGLESSVLHSPKRTTSHRKESFSVQPYIKPTIKFISNRNIVLANRFHGAPNQGCIVQNMSPLSISRPNNKRSQSCKDCYLKCSIIENHRVYKNQFIKQQKSTGNKLILRKDASYESGDESWDKNSKSNKKKNSTSEWTTFKRFFNSRTIKKVNKTNATSELMKHESEKSKTPALQSKPHFLEMNKDEMMKDFGRRIENNAFYENNMNIFEGYLKSFITRKKEEVDDQFIPVPETNVQIEHVQSSTGLPKKKSLKLLVKSMKSNSSAKKHSHLDMYLYN